MLIILRRRFGLCFDNSSRLCFSKTNQTVFLENMWSQSASLLSNIGHPLPAQFFLEPTLLYTFLGGMGLSLSKLVLSNIHQYHIHTHLSQVKCLPMSLPWLRASMTVENREGIAGMGRTTFSTCWLKKGGFKQATILHFSGHLERMGVGGR